MAYSDELVKYFQQSILDRGNSVFVEHGTIPFKHFINEEGILELIVDRVISFVFNDDFDGSEFLVGKAEEEYFVFLDGSIDELPDDVA